jgi:hypothetical protein
VVTHSGAGLPLHPCLVSAVVPAVAHSGAGILLHPCLSGALVPAVHLPCSFHLQVVTWTTGTAQELQLVTVLQTWLLRWDWPMIGQQQAWRRCAWS